MSSEDTTRPLPKALSDWEERLTRLEDEVKELKGKFEKRGYDTRPFFEDHENRIMALEDTKRAAAHSKSALLVPVTFENGLCWAEGDSEPLCPHCWEGDHQMRHLRPPDSAGDHECTHCKNWFKFAKREPRW